MSAVVQSPHEGLPGRWQWGIGEGSRDLHTGGYYMHYATYQLWANQYREHFVEVRIETGGNPPDEHFIQVALYEEDKVAGEIREVRRLDYDSVDVDIPRSEKAQNRAESDAEKRAKELMQAVIDGEYDLEV